MTFVFPSPVGMSTARGTPPLKKPVVQQPSLPLVKATIKGKGSLEVVHYTVAPNNLARNSSSM